MNPITLVTALQRLTRCLLVSSLLVIAGHSQAIERVTYYHNDALGSPVAATDASGTLLWREEYKPYGDRIKREAGSKDTAWYTGKQEEAEFGISYFGARWYDPKIGRFLAKDPVGFNPDNINSFSKYAYANNNPYVYVDPDGNFAILGAVVASVADIVTQGLMISAGAQAEFSLGSVAVAAGLGAATGGLANLKKAYDAGKILKNARNGTKVTKGTKPAISAQKQAGHISGTPQNANRLKQGKPTSSFFGEKSGDRLTQQAFEKGKPVPGRPNVREHDFGVSTGTGPNGGMQSRVRVHQDSKGRIHGHPSGPERF